MKIKKSLLCILFFLPLLLSGCDVLLNQDIREDLKKVSKVTYTFYTDELLTESVTKSFNKNVEIKSTDFPHPSSSYYNSENFSFYGYALTLSSSYSTNTSTFIKSNGSTVELVQSLTTNSTALSFFAIWDIKSYTVHFEVSNADNKNNIPDQTVFTGHMAYTPVNPIRSGYDFAGWYTESSFENIYDFSTPVTSDITLYPKWIYNGTTYSVSSSSGNDDTGTGEQSLPLATINKAIQLINEAESWGTDYTIYVTGTFTDSVEIPDVHANSLIIEGLVDSSNSNTANISSANGYGITINATPNITLKNLNIKNNGLNGILIGSGTNINIENCLISNNNTSSTCDGGGINNSGNLYIKDSTISQNKGKLVGGGLLNSSVGFITIESTTICDNTCTDTSYSNGGGISNEGNISLVNCTISQNKSYTCGGGICNTGLYASLYINYSSTVTKNYSGYGGGICSEFAATLNIDDTTFTENTAETDGGALKIWKTMERTSTGEIVNTTTNLNSAYFNNNTAPVGGTLFIGDGGALACYIIKVNNDSPSDNDIYIEEGAVVQLMSGDKIGLNITLDGSSTPLRLTSDFNSVTPINISLTDYTLNREVLCNQESYNVVEQYYSYFKMTNSYYTIDQQGKLQRTSSSTYANAGISIYTTQSDVQVTIENTGKIYTFTAPDTYSSYRWIFDDNEISGTENSVVVDFSSYSAGVYDLVLIATDSNGNQYSDFYQVEVE